MSEALCSLLKHFTFSGLYSCENVGILRKQTKVTKDFLARSTEVIDIVEQRRKNKHT